MVIVGTGRQPDQAPTSETLLGPEIGLPDPNKIGIVFVHGIGSQKPGETLLSWARPLLRLIRAWAATTNGVEPLNDPTKRANVDFSGTSRPFIEASVPALRNHPAQTWVMTEAWWATRVSPPSIGEMFSWLFPGEMIRLVRGIVSGLARSGTSGFVVLDLIFLPLFIIPATLLVLLIYVVFRLMRAIPWKPIQDFAALAMVEFFLVDWFGDVRILLTDRAQAANIRARVADAIKELVDNRCGTIVMIGHSGGTIAGYMTLADVEYERMVVREFITHGQALGIAWRLGHADEYSAPDRRSDRLYRGDRLRGNLSTLPFRAEMRWHDFWATHDAAPAGGLTRGPRVTTPEEARGQSTRIFNRMSLRNDHGGYWDNDEEFVLPVARLIELAPEGAQNTSRFFPESPVTQRVERRQKRVKLLQFAWIAVMVSAVVAVPLALIDPLIPGDKGSIETAGQETWAGIGALIKGLGPIASFFEVEFEIPPIDGGVAILVGVIVLVAAYWLVGRAMSGLWTAWDARERQISLQPIPQWRSMFPLALQLGACAAAALWLLTFAASGSWLLAMGSVGAVLVGYFLRFVTNQGVVVRPSEAELEEAGVLP